MDSHYYRQWQTWLLIWQTNRNTYATISNSFSPTYVIYDIPSPTFLTRKVLIVSKKKKKHQKKGEWGRRVHQHEAPTPSGSIKNQLPPKKEGERAEIWQSRIEDEKFFSTFRTSEWTRTQRIFFFSHRIFFFFYFLFWTWRTSIQLRFFDTWRKFHSTSVDLSWVRSSSYLSSYGPGLLTPRSPWAHLSRLRFKSKQSTNPNQVIRQHRKHNGQFQSHNTPSGSRNR